MGQDLLTILRSGSSQGFIWALLAIGVFISFRLLDSADLTLEGSFPLGACVSAALISFSDVNPWLTLLIAFGAGVLAGMATALLHTVFKIPVLLGGIITMTGLYSINRAICNRQAMVSLLNKATIFSPLQDAFGLKKIYCVMILGALILLVVAALIYLFFGTEIGAAVRGTGMNPRMAKSLGINTSVMEIVGLGLSNGLIALSGAILAQNNGQATIDLGRGAIVIGLASIILGEAIFGKRSFLNWLLAVIGGAVLYQLISATTVQLGIDELWFKLITAVFIVVVLALPTVRGWIGTSARRLKLRKGA